MKPHKKRRAIQNAKPFIEQNFTDQEWKSYQPEGPLSQEKSAEMQAHILQYITKQIDQKESRKARIVQLSRYVSAASVIIMLGMAVYIILYNPPRPQPIIQQAATKTITPAIPKEEWKQIDNTTNRVRLHRLPDQSVVSLYPNSNIRYEEQFDQKFRDIYLQGKAKFKVSHNKARPFSVYSGALKTTALGTSFTINTRGKRISVKLHTGKIVIANHNTKKTLAYISQPGNTLYYNPELDQTSIAKAPSIPSYPASVLKREGTLITMKNIPLSKVFSLLNEAYGVKVNITQEQISTISFTGNIDTAKEQPEDILNMICLINNMQLVKVSAQEFTIQKSN